MKHYCKIEKKRIRKENLKCGKCDKLTRDSCKVYQVQKEMIARNLNGWQQHRRDEKRKEKQLKRLSKMGVKK